MTTLMTTSRTPSAGRSPWPCSGVLAERAAAHTCDDPFSTDLIAGQTIDAGDVKVCNDDTTLTVTYEATFPWCLLEDRPARRDQQAADIPQNRPATRRRASSPTATSTVTAWMARPASRSRWTRSMAG